MTLPSPPENLHTPPQDGRRYRPVYRAELVDGLVRIYTDEIVRWEPEGYEPEVKGYECRSIDPVT